jgi:hypothetical protein
MPQENVRVDFSANPGNFESVMKRSTHAMQDMARAYNELKATAANSGQTSRNFANAVSGSASKVNTLGDAVKNANMNGFNNQLGMTCDKVFGVSLAVNAVTGAFKALVGQWRHALDVQLELVAAERLLRVATEDGGAAFDWLNYNDG